MIDCDVHQNFRSIAELLPYLAETHREHILHGGYAGIGLPEYHWTHPEDSGAATPSPRREARPGPTTTFCGSSSSTPTGSTTPSPARTS
jgi:hypothetical protein